MPSCTFSVTVTNAAPVLTYASPQTVFLGQGITINPATGPSDTNPATITVQSVDPGFSGTVTVNNTTGVVTITNATPIGSFPITIRATDTCGTTTDATFILNVVCPAITVNPASLPGGTIGTAYNQTVSAVPAGVYSFTVTSGGLPIGLSLNAGTGVISGTPTQGGTYSFRITATSGFNCTGFRDYTVTITCPVITLTSPLPPATAGIAYSASVAASPEGSYIYSVVLGTLPYGLTLGSTTGTISGLPTVAGTFNFSIKADRGNGCVGTQAYTMVVGCPTITVLPNTLPNGTVGTGYSQTLSATPATGSYSFAVSSGSLPPGLSLITTGLLSGTPTANGTYNFSVTATAFGTCTSAPKSYSITIGSGGCPTITLPSSLPNGTVGQPYSNSVAASPSGSYTYTVTAGSLPTGVTLYSSIGLLYGYPTTNGAYPFTITATNSNNCTGSQSYTVVIGGGAGFLAINDFSGDRQSDFVLWRPAQMRWLIVNSSTGAAQTTQWGNAGDKAVAGDYDGDGKSDWAAFGSDGHWRIKLSGDGTTLDKPWGGLASDVPVPGDYDGDGKTDIAVWRGAETVWYILRSSDGQTQTISWGASYAPYYDVPVPADYDGDGKTDAAVFRKSTGHWYIKRSSDGQTVDKYWGMGTDVPVPADYDGDGKADVAVWRGNQSLWYIIRSSDDTVDTKTWGASYSPYFDMPAVGDYDGDGKADIAVWRKSEGRWYVVQSSDGATRTVTQGQASDRPVTSTP
jgi:hypothetical protein